MKKNAFIPFLFLSSGLSLLGADSGILNLYILTGQSNSFGWITGQESLLSEEKRASHATTADQVKFWHGNMSGSPSTAFGAVVPQVSGVIRHPSLGPEFGFAHFVNKKGWQELLGGNNGGDFGIVKVSRAGGANDFWLPTGNVYQRIVSTMNNAVRKAKEDGYTSVNIVGLMYLQGEDNSTAGAEAAGDRLGGLVDNLKTDLSKIDGVTFSDSYHVAAGEPAANNYNGVHPEGVRLTSRNNLEKKVLEMGPDGKTYGEWVPTHDLEKGSDNIHFNGQSELTIGARYAYVEALRAGYVETSSIRNFNLDATLDSADAYHSGKTSQNEVVTWDIASSTITKVSSSDESVKLYGIRVDSDAGNYLQTGATRIHGVVTKSGGLSADSARLTIGAGGISIGKNLTLATNLGVDASQTWTLEAGTKLAVEGSVFVTLSEENLDSALITKSGTGELKLSNDVALGILFDTTMSLAAGEYDFKIFSGFSESELSVLAERFILLAENENWLSEGMSFDATTGILKITAIPEPSTFGLLAGLGALAFVAARRRRSRKAA